MSSHTYSKSVNDGNTKTQIQKLFNRIEELFRLMPEMSQVERSELIINVLKLISNPKQKNKKNQSLDTLIMRIGRNIRIARKAKGISQEELAKKCGIHRTYLGTIENGKRNTSIQKIVQISEVLDVSVESILS